MKYISLILNLVLLVAVGVLFYLHFSDQDENVAVEQNESPFGKELTIAYINSDSLLNNYSFFKEMAEKLEDKRQKLEAEYKNRAQGLQNEINNFKQSAGTMTISQARAVEEDLMRKQQNLVQYQDRLTQELLQEEAKINEQLYDKVSKYLQDYGKSKSLELVLTYQKGSGVLYANDSLNITEQVVDGLNQEYSSADRQEGTVQNDTTASN